MSRFARVTSISVLQLTQAALQKFRSESAAAIDDLSSDIRRVVEWIHHDRKEYWAHEQRRSWEAVTQARLQLQQARTSRRMVGHEPACVDEERALARAKHRLETAEEKVRAVQHWTHAIDRAVDEFQQSRTRFVTWLDTDMVKAVAALNRLSEALDDYVSLEAPSESLVPPPVADGATQEAKPELAPTEKSEGGEP
jgi:hypothetical protein